MRSFALSCFLIIEIISSILLSTDVSGRCLSDQQSLLLQLNNSLIFDTTASEFHFLEWNPSTDCCTWTHVTCHEGRVIGLDLSNKNIVGGIDNSSLFNLQYLRSLDLSLNNFNASIPPSFGALANLRYLNLSDAGFMGQIPIDLSSLTSLVTLDLSASYLIQRNLLKLENPNLLMLIQDLAKLEELRLDGVNLSASGNEWCQALSSSLPNLRVLSLSRCSLSGPIDDSLAKLQSLSMIFLDSNNLSTLVPGFLANFTNLTSLQLSSCELHGAFPQAIFQVPTLKSIDMANNRLLQGSLPEFSQNNSLSGTTLKLADIDLSSNSFDGSIPSSLFALPSLERIELSNNKFNGQLPEFPNPHSSILAVLDLSNNFLEGPIPVSIFKLKKLRFLVLSFNRLNSTIQPDIIQGLSSLISLDLSYNNLSVNALGTTWSSLPKNLIKLNLASCKLTKFPPNLMNLSELHYLDLSDNQIHGEVPNWIWKVGKGLFQLNLSLNYLVGIQEPYSPPPRLGILDLHMNQIRGKFPILPESAFYVDLSSNYFNSSIPADIGDFLIFLSLSDNSLTGFIPNSMCNARNLYVLDLSNNSLSGRIPSCMSELTPSLVVLNLRGNKFSGPLPYNFLVYCALQTLDLNGNSIEMKIPKSLSHCTELEILDLGNNKLIGEFPCFLKTTSTLRVLILRSNRFHGSINCFNAIETWEKLQIIDISHNNFSGEIPEGSLARWNGMKMDENDSSQSQLDPLQVEVLIIPNINYRDSVEVTSKGLESRLVKILTIYTAIDFSSNNFNGAIPEEIGELTLLYVLNLSNNAFRGSIPSTLSKLQHLESLDLSSNKLGGAIPTSLANLNFLSYLNLSFNELVGRVPSGSQFQTFSADSFMGNEGLCGFPLINCTDTGSPDASNHDSSTSERKINWNLLSAEIGFIVGFGIVVGPLLLCKRWRKSYFETVEDVAFKVLPSAVTRKLLQWGVFE